MGTWICHLRVADLVLHAIPHLDEITFLYGNLAPDSGLPNETWTEFDPPKEVTHYLRKGDGGSAIHDLEYFREYLAGPTLREDPLAYSFRFGYHCHLICDIVWARGVGATTMIAFAGEIAADENAAWERIKDDWYGLDHLYLRDHRDNAFWRVIATTANPPSHLPFVNEKALHHQYDHIRRFYSQSEERWFRSRPYVYLNEATMSRSVNDSVAAILYMHERLNRMNGAGVHKSSAELLPRRLLRPYSMPLGDAG